MCEREFFKRGERKRNRKRDGKKERRKRKRERQREKKRREERREESGMSPNMVTYHDLNLNLFLIFSLTQPW